MARVSSLFLSHGAPTLPLTDTPAHHGPAHHLRIGRALVPLRHEGVLIIGSGSFTHDLSEFRGHALNDPAPVWVNSFADWFHAALMESQTDDLLNYRRLAPHATKNHPTEEHLFVKPFSVYAFQAPSDAAPSDSSEAKAFAD